MINWMYYPPSDQPPEIVRQVVGAFETVAPHIDSVNYQLHSDSVLALLRPGLESIGFRVERGKTKAEKIHMPVLFGLQGRTVKAFEADAFSREHGFVLEVEAGRGVTNNQFLKDLFQACMMCEARYFGVAVRNIYRRSHDFNRVVKFFDTLYASRRLNLPINGIVAIGY